MGRAEQWLAKPGTVVREMEEYERERLLRAAYQGERAKHEGPEAEFKGDRSLCIFLEPSEPSDGEHAAGGWRADLPDFGITASGATAERALKEALFCIAEATLEDLRDQD